MTRLVVIAAICLEVLAGSAHAAALTLSGYFNDPANAALFASDGYLDIQAARFAGDDEIAKNVAIYTMTVSTPGTFTFDSLGFAALGAEPYFTIFEGAGGDAAFLDSNFFDPQIDFSLSRALTAGTYMLAVGVWPNMSFAENNPDGTPTLSDGFTALGDPNRLGNYYYALNVASDDGAFDAVPATDLGGGGTNPVPEPSTLLLLGSGLGLLARRQTTRRSAVVD